MQMVVVLQVARGGSKGVKNKNVYQIFDKPLMAYSLIEARKIKEIEYIFLSTDNKEIADVGQEYGAKIIKRPDELAQDSAPFEEAIFHGFQEIEKILGQEIDILTILQGNSATLSADLIKKGIKLLKERADLDSCVTVSKYNEYNPTRARFIDNSGLLQTVLSQRQIQSFGFGSDRGSMGDIYFMDGGVQICKRRCMNFESGLLPYRWIGRNIYPLIQEDGIDVDNLRGIAQTKFWLKKYGNIFP
jgi:CMP-N-acetylneuraminic acid synthetase